MEDSESCDNELKTFISNLLEEVAQMLERSEARIDRTNIIIDKLTNAC